jgi:hypothetical protein
MTIIDNEMLWRQFGAAIDMFGNALRDCPDELWEKRLWEDEPDQWVAAGFSAFWYLGYHTLFWLDLYLTGAEEGFAPPGPFDLVEMDPDEVLPRRAARLPGILPPEVPGDDWRSVKRTGEPVVPVRLGRTALCGASVVQSASCSGTRRTTVLVPGTAGGKIRKLGIPGSVRIPSRESSLSRNYVICIEWDTFLVSIRAYS